jgi:hypothetical protein
MFLLNKANISCWDNYRSSYQTHCNTSDNVCLNLYNCCYSIYASGYLVNIFQISLIEKESFGQNRCRSRHERLKKFLSPLYYHKTQHTFLKVFFQVWRHHEYQYPSVNRMSATKYIYVK